MRQSGVADEFTGMWLGKVKPLNEEQEELRLKLRDVVIKGKPWCLVIAGTKGNGKSFWSQVAVNTYNNDGFCGGLYTTQPILQSELRDNGSKAFAKYSKAPVLVIDEISDRPDDWTEFIKTNAENILIERHRNNLRTVLIGNTTIQRMVAMFDVRVRDRLREGTHMVMKEESLRETYEN